MASKTAPDILQRHEVPDGEIDRGVPTVKNKFRWDWLTSKDVHGDFLSDFIRKLKQNGEAWCLMCKCVVSYGSSGLKALKAHASSKKHTKVRSSLNTSQALPVLYQTLKKLTSAASDSDQVDLNPNKTATSARSSTTGTTVYGQPPNIIASTSSTAGCDVVTVEPKFINLRDRVSHQEALVASFVAEHNIPFSVAPHLISLAKELSRDPKALSELSMCRKTVSYKLRQGLSDVLHKRLVQDMTKHTFSLNLDEATSKGSKERVLNILVSYFSEDSGCCSVYHYASITMTTVNAEIVFNAVTDQLSRDGIPLSNVISCLTDSASYMAGNRTGFLKRMMDVCPNMIDIDNDICHHVHNCVKLFCSNFDHTLEKLFDDLHTDFDYGTDLGSYLEEICRLLCVRYYRPKERVPHRWLSVLDCAMEFKLMQVPLTIFYFSFLKASDKMLYNSVVLDIMKSTSKEARQRIYQIFKILKSKSLTTPGKQRKDRIIQNLFLSACQTQSLLDLYTSILPLFKSFILSFESAEPKMHLLFDKQETLVRNYFACFLKPETFSKLSPRQLLTLNLMDGNNLLSWNQVFTSTNSNHSKPFVQKVIAAYQHTGCYIQKKFPLNNMVLRDLSAIDPRAIGHSVTMKCFDSMLKRMPALLSNADDEIECREQVRKLQIEKDLPEFQITDRVDKWWSQFFTSHGDWPQLGKLVKACLSIFTGPRVESSFSLMNNIITSQTNRLDTQTYSAIQAVKYFLIVKGKSSLEYFHRDNVLTSPVDKPLIYHIQTARSKDKNRLAQTHLAKQLEIEKFKLPASAKPTKPNYHVMAAQIKSKLTAHRKRKTELVNPRPAKKKKV